MKKAFGFLAMAILGGVITLGGYKLFLEDSVIVERTIEIPTNIVQTSVSSIIKGASAAEMTTDFTVAAENTIHAVVHVKNTAVKTQVNPWAEQYYGRGQGTKKYEQVGTGSGVIISADGYIVTNNHVIDGASELEITLNNKKKYKAVLVGNDAANDIALLKIESNTNFPYVPFANSDNIKIGEWVLAVGNPYNLTSTVTAGIVSAKGRDLEGNRNIESFIQTDAAVNPGNSGGALVNGRGELIGINTAISTKTGSFIGYSFAVPSNIAKKIIDDILEFGAVQQAILGITVDLSYKDQGVKVSNVLKQGENKVKSELKEGDIIKRINNIKISKFSELKGQLTAKRPNEVVDVTIERNGKLITKKVKLSKFIERHIATVFQWELKNISKEEIKKLNISNGVQIIRTGKDSKENNLKNYIIVRVNEKRVTNAKETAKLLDQLGKRGFRIAVEMINIKGEKELYTYR
uniref:Periplasmic serine protease n=1 Tax=uncultured Polaribacter sp. TaxID=174711 RepID=F4MLF2_9FLAO|nr:serine protease, peptidase S1 family [uncultured bacterium]CBL80513.1 periplasmic serine protease [uncultured Polaribacter sp.]